MQDETKERIQYLDSLRAFAIFLVCLGHVLWYLETDCNIFVFEHIKTAIYLFHMPLFFILSGFTYEMFEKRGTVPQLKRMLRKRTINLVLPAVFMVAISFLAPVKEQTIFDYYQKGWFLIFLALIILINGFMDFLLLNRISIEKVIFILSLLAWLAVGLVQIFLIRSGILIVAKFTCEISKFFGYLACFLFARQMARQKERIMQMDFRFWMALLFATVSIGLGVAFRVDANDALIKLVCGFPASMVLLILFERTRKRCGAIERKMSRYSLEIYLIHWDIIHGILLPLLSLQITTLPVAILFAAVLLLADVALPVFIGCCEEHLILLRLFFHPAEHKYTAGGG